MRYENVSLAGLGYSIPPEVETSEALEGRLAPVYARLGLHLGRLELMTGIRERRYWPGHMRPSGAATLAGADALEKCGIDRARIGALVHASVCRDFLEPATANVVHHALGLSSSCQVFDVSNACLGVLTGVLMVANMVELGQIEAGLVVAGENGKPLVDGAVAALLADDTLTRKSIKGAFASLTIGSGAVAVVVSKSSLAPAGHRLHAAVSRVATQHHELCQGGVADGRDGGLSATSTLVMQTDSEALLHAGIALARETYLELIAASPKSFDRFMTHQVGRAHHQLLFGALELPPERGYTTFERFGNVGSVSLPLSAALASEAGEICRGDEVAFLGIGSGLGSVMMGVSW